MKPVLIFVTLLGFAAAAAAIYTGHCDAQALRQEIAELRAEVQRLGRAQAGTEARPPTAVVLTPEQAGSVAPEQQKNELAKLRGEVAELKKDTAALNRLAQAAQTRTADAVVPTKLVPANDWRNAGRTTPENTAQTLIWAASAGELGTLADTLTLTPTARAKAEALFSGLPEQTRQQYGTADKLVALMLARDAGGVSGMQVVAQREVGADEVGMRVRFGADDGTTKDEKFLLRRATDGWRVVISDAPVDKWAKQIKGGR